MSIPGVGNRLNVSVQAPLSVMREFQQFLARGNVIDLAVGVIIGAAFGKIVTSLVSDVLMPPIGLLIGGINFDQFKLVLRAADPANKKPEVAIGYGAFFDTAFQFLIVAVVVFFIVKLVNGLRREEAAEPTPPPAPTTTEVLLGEIRDLLKAR